MSTLDSHWPRTRPYTRHWKCAVINDFHKCGISPKYFDAQMQDPILDRHVYSAVAPKWTLTRWRGSGPSITERAATWRSKSRPSARHWWPLLLMEVWKWVTKIVIWANTNVSLTSRFPSFLIIRQSDCFFSSQKRLVCVKTIWQPTPWHLLPGFHHSLPTWLLPHLRVLLASLMQSNNLVGPYFGQDWLPVTGLHLFIYPGRTITLWFCNFVVKFGQIPTILNLATLQVILTTKTNLFPSSTPSFWTNIIRI